MATAGGRLIVMCGIDGSGKSVQTRMLCERVGSTGRRVETADFPRYETFFGDLIARYLRGEFGTDANAVDPHLAALAFACDRWQAAPGLRRRLDEGAVVICNRYVSANLAHQGAKIDSDAERRQFVAWVETMEYDVFGLPRPDLHVWLKTSPELSRALIGTKKARGYLGDAEDIHERDDRHLTRTHAIYAALAAERADWLTVECAEQGAMRPAEEIAEDVWSGVQRLL